MIAALNKLRERSSATTRIFVMVPVSGKARAEITDAVKTSIGNSKDPQIHLVDLGPIQFETTDGQHPTAAGHKSIYHAALPHFDRLLGKTSR